VSEQQLDDIRHVPAQTRDDGLTAAATGVDFGVTGQTAIVSNLPAALVFRSVLVPLTAAMGFAMAVAVLFDAVLVRMTVIPAVMALLAARRGGCLRGWTGWCPMSTSRAAKCGPAWTSRRYRSRREDQSRSAMSRRVSP
jgi:hypothetical protein